MAIVLSVETATHACSVAVHQEGKLLAASELHIAQTAGSKLAVLIDQLLVTCGLTPAQLDAVAISSGPGSYTGLRIGVATAKGLCFALRIPLISINTLELMAFQVKKNIMENSFGLGGGNILLCPMLDARRMEVYALLADSGLHIIIPTEAKVIDEQSFEHELDKGTIFFFGDGAEKCRSMITHPNARFINGIVPLAAMMGELAFGKWQAGQTEDLSAFEPYYLKDFMIRKPKEA